MSASDEARAWAQTVQAVAKDRDAVYEPVGGINPVGGPVALCPGGTNRITGQLADGFWGASCDADEHEEGGLFSKAVLPGALLAKSQVPDLARVMPPFNVESVERRPEELVMQRASRRKVEFESLDFNKRFLATVPSEYDPVALRVVLGGGGRALSRSARGGARQRRRAVQAGAQRGRGVGRPHLPGGPVARRTEAVPGRLGSLSTGRRF